MTEEHRTRGSRGGVTVHGSGVAQAVPDVVVAELGAEARALDAERALGLAGDALARMTDSLRSAGVEDRALRTASPSSWTDGSRVVVRLGLTVTLRDVAASGDLFSAAVTAGGEEARLDGVRFEVSDPREAQTRAREAAWADAMTKGTHWATLAGRALGEVVWVQESGAEASPMFAARAGAVSAMSVPVEAGEQAVRADVSVRWVWAEPSS